jgi:hypothetical protein
MAQSFKTLIFLTIPLNVFVVILVCVGLATQHWVDGLADDGNSSTTIEFNFGLFAGSKTKNGKYLSTFNLDGKDPFTHPVSMCVFALRFCGLPAFLSLKQALYIYMLKRG